MRGTRVDWGDGIGPLNVGEYSQAPDGHWQATTPNGHGANFANHEVIELPNGSITVIPSILVFKGGTYDKDGKLIRDETFVELYHGYLELGVWRSCT